jgi:hypothetical protein
MAKKKLVAVLFAATLPTAIGCTPSRPVVGVVSTPREVARRVRVGSMAPSIRFRTDAGVEYDTRSLYGDATVVAFPEAEGADCGRINERLVKEADRLAQKYVAFLEFIRPEGGCPHGKGCTLARRVEVKNVAMLCDGEGTARKLFEVEEPGAVFVLDRAGRIEATGRFEELEALTERARSVARRAVTISPPF